MIKLRKAVEEFEQKEQFKARDEKEERLIEAFSHLQNQELAQALLRDLFTLPEIQEFANRLEIARLLKEGHSYQEVADITKVSTTTVTRVAHWVFNGCGGYYKILESIKKR